MIQWAKPVVQLASQTPDFGVDRGKPILVVMPFSLWLGLSFFISFPLWARVKAQRAQKKTLIWLIMQTARLIGKAISMTTRCMKWMSDFARAEAKKRKTQPGPYP
jgi:hypothetical protein